jgi:hypothetical protein
MKPFNTSFLVYQPLCMPPISPANNPIHIVNHNLLINIDFSVQHAPNVYFPAVHVDFISAKNYCKQLIYIH